MSKKLSGTAKVAVGAAVLIGIGAAIYNAFAGSNSSEADAKPKESRTEEEKKEEEPYVLRLDPEVDLDSLTCPITCQTINEPASTIYGHLFELSAIRAWVEQKGSCPLTHKPLRLDQI